MNTELFIAKRFISGKNTEKKFAAPIIRLTVFAITLSVAVMIISIAIVTGFKKEIRSKAIGFGSHIQIINYDSNNSYETAPINKNFEFLPIIDNLPGIANIQVYATKPGLIKTKKDIQGVVVKGIDTDFDWSFFKQNLTQGDTLNLNDSTRINDIIISEKLCTLLGLALNEELTMFFIDEKPRVRRFKIGGIYATSLEEFDKKFIYADIKHVQRLNNWESNQVSGIEILLESYDDLDNLSEQIRTIAAYRFQEDGSRLRVTNIRQLYPQIFDWLSLLDMNVWVILLIMTTVAVINMVSGLIIIILDRTNSIGLLKALGGSNGLLRNIFLAQAGFIIFKGLLYGNILALTFCFIQDKFHLIKLNQATYFTDFVPINLPIAWIFAINLTALLIVFVAMLLPVIIVSKINPVKTLRYE